MSDRKIGLEILDGAREIKAFKGGKGELIKRKLSEPSDPKEIREKINLSQSSFAGSMGVSVRTVQDWEQERTEPSGDYSRRSSLVLD